MAVDPDVRRFRPVWPDLATLPKGELRFVYDRLTDTLFADFYASVRPTATEPLDVGDRDYLFVRVDPETSEVVGLQIEDFRSYALAIHPDFVTAFELAELRGFNDLEAARLRRRARGRAQGQADGIAFIAAVERASA